MGAEAPDVLEPGPRLAPVDEANLVLDHPGQVNVFLVAGLVARGGFVGADAEPDLDALRSVLAARVAAVPALRVVPRRAGRRHRWAATEPDLEQHVRLVAPVAGLPGLERLCGDLMSVPLDRDRPMWELLIVPGVGGGLVGVILRIHHAIADGMAAAAIVQRLFEPDAGPPSPSAPQPRRAPPAVEKPRGAIERFAFGARRILLTLRGSGVGPTVLLGDRGPRRAVAFVDAPLDGLQHRARSVGATVNDVLLSAVASGYGAALPAAGETPPEWLPVSVPVALGRRDAAANQVGVMVVRLPLHEDDPDRRLQLIAEQTRVEKVRARDQGTLEMLRGPVGARLMNRLARRQHFVAGFVTNVPGPAARMRLAGAPLDALWPVSVLAANVRLGVAAVSYAGRLWCSVQYDPDAVPGAEFGRAMSAELTRLGSL